MLKKLFKYDMIALSRVLIIVHLILIPIIAFIVMFVVPDIEQNGVNLINICGMLLYFIYTVIASTFTTLYIAIYFYKNLFSDQGYLTLTLPATPFQHLMSKTLAGGLWTLIDLLFINGSLLLIYFSGTVQKALLTSEGLDARLAFERTNGMTLNQFLAFILILSAISCIGNPLFAYGTVCAGQLFSSHRILWAVIIYVLITGISALFGGVFGASLSLRQLTTLPEIELLPMLFFITIFPAIIFAAAGGSLSYYVLKKKVNLQ